MGMIFIHCFELFWGNVVFNQLTLEKSDSERAVRILVVLCGRQGMTSTSGRNSKI